MRTEVISRPHAPVPRVMTGGDVATPTGADRSEPARRFARRLGAVTVVAGLWRVAYVVALRDTPVSVDGFAYSAVGRFVAEGVGFHNPLQPEAATALHPPAWSTVLAAPSALGFDTILSHQIVAALIGTVTVALVGLLGRRLAGDVAGLVAACLAAAHPELWLWERELASETILLPLSVLVIIQAYRVRDHPSWQRVAGLGAVIGLLVLTRSEQGLLFIVLAVPVVTLAPGLERRRRLALTALVLGTALIVTAPWLAYNHDRFEQPVYLTSGAGVTLRYANTPLTYHGPLLGYGDPRIWERLPFGDDSQADARYRREALEYIAADPMRLPVVIAAREGRTWGLYRSDQQATLDRAWGGSPRWVYVTGLWVFRLTVPLAVLGAAVLRRRRLSLVPLVAPIAVAAAYVAITYGQTRYRVTADIALIVLSAVAVDHLVGRPRRPRPTRRPVAPTPRSDVVDLRSRRHGPLAPPRRPNREVVGAGSRRETWGFGSAG